MSFAHFSLEVTVIFPIDFLSVINLNTLACYILRHVEWSKSHSKNLLTTKTCDHVSTLLELFPELAKGCAGVGL